MSRPEPTISDYADTDDLRADDRIGVNRRPPANQKPEPSARVGHTQQFNTDDSPRPVALVGMDIPFYQLLAMTIKTGFALVPLIFIVALALAGARIFFKSFLAYYGVAG